jgi:hypothetical protein
MFGRQPTTQSTPQNQASTAAQSASMEQPMKTAGVNEQNSVQPSNQGNIQQGTGSSVMPRDNPYLNALNQKFPEKTSSFEEPGLHPMNYASSTEETSQENAQPSNRGGIQPERSRFWPDMNIETSEDSSTEDSSNDYSSKTSESERVPTYRPGISGSSSEDDSSSEDYISEMSESGQGTFVLPQRNNETPESKDASAKMEYLRSLDVQVQTNEGQRNAQPTLGQQATNVVFFVSNVVSLPFKCVMRGISTVLSEVIKNHNSSPRQTTGMKHLDKKINNEDSIKKINDFATSSESREFLSALNTLAKSSTFNKNNFTALISDERIMNDPKMQETIKCAARILDARLKNPDIEHDEKKTDTSYGFTIDKKNNIYVRSGEVLGKGSFKKAKVAVKLQSMKEYANISVKDKPKETNGTGTEYSGTEGAENEGAAYEVKKEQQALKDLQGCRNIIKPPLFTVETKGKSGQAKFVIMQKKLEGEGNILFKFSTDKIVSAMRDVAIGLGDIHGVDLIHSDVKLANMLIDKNGRGFVHDFGTLCKRDDIQGGSPIYFAPEILEDQEGEGQGYITDKADSFSFGLCLLMLAAPNEFDSDDDGFPYPATKDTDRCINEMGDSERKAFIEKAENSIITDSKLSQVEINDKLKLILVSKQLLTQKPEDRISCAEAGVLLT